MANSRSPPKSQPPHFSIFRSFIGHECDLANETIREQGVRSAVAILAFVTLVAVSTGALLNHGFKLFGIAY